MINFHMLCQDWPTSTNRSYNNFLKTYLRATCLYTYIKKGEGGAVEFTQMLLFTNNKLR